MSKINISGDLKEFSSRQLELIYNVLEDMGVKEKDIIIETLGKPGDNFASEVKVIKVNDKNEEILRIILKKPAVFTGEENPLSFFSNIIFSNEITMYAEVLQMMTQLQISADVKETELFKYANCCSAIREKANEIILLEDLSKEKYIMLDKLESLSNETIKIVLNNLATYHSLSYALKDKYPEIYSAFAEKLVDIQTAEENKENFSALTGLAENFSNLFSNNRYKNIIKHVFKEQVDKTFKIVEADKRSKYSVIIHGDCWTNNMLFQLKDGAPNKCVFIDYQLARESLPVADILYMLFNCTDYKTRSEYYYDWIDYYHSQLEKNLFTFGLRINNIYPRDKLDTDLRRYCKIYLGMAMMTTGMLLRETSESIKIKDGFTEAGNVEEMLGFMKISDDLKTNTITKIKDRISGLIDSCIEFGYLNVN